jgi:hypothetical protein
MMMTREERREYDRERRFDKKLREEERKWHAEIKALMDTGLSFDEAWVAAGGMIIPDGEA